MANLDIELGSELVERVKCLATRHYGDSGDTSIGRVVQSALRMRLLATELVEGGGNETEEPETDWEFTNEQPVERLPSEIRGFLLSWGKFGRDIL